MLSRFPTLDLYLWFATMSLQGAVALLTYFSDSRQRFVWFWRFIVASVLTDVALFAAVLTSSLSAFQAITFASSIVTAILTICILAELWTLIIGPKFTLPHWVLPDFVKCVITVSAVLWPVAFVVDMTLKPHPFSGFLATCSTLDEIMEGAILTVLVCMLLYTRHLKLKPLKADLGIAAGFVICLSAALVTDAIRSHGGTGVAVVAQRALQCVYCASLILWARSVRRKEPVGSLATLEEMMEYSEILVPIERELKLRA